MSLKSFLKFVEIRTKLASIIPFLLGSIYTLYQYKIFVLHNFILMFVSLICFDMATTAINNYCDYRKANKAYLHNHKAENAIVRDDIKENTALNIIFTLLFIAITFGILLTLNTNIIVLLIGVLSFSVGILYTFGPIPISRMPLGELFSGVFMGFIIIFLSIYIHIFSGNMILLTFKNNIITLSVNVIELLQIFLLSIPAIGGIANIMLANNICDVEKDIIDKRYTLPYYIGKKYSLLLFKALYYIGFIDITVLVLLKLVPITTLLVLFTIIPVNKNIKSFFAIQSKSDTFPLSVKNFLLINAAQILSIGLTLIIYLFFKH